MIAFSCIVIVANANASECVAFLRSPSAFHGSTRSRSRRRARSRRREPTPPPRAAARRTSPRRAMSDKIVEAQKVRRTTRALRDARKRRDAPSRRRIKRQRFDRDALGLDRARRRARGRRARDADDDAPLGALELDRTTDETRARRRGAARQFFQSQKGFVHLKRGGVDRVTSVLIPVGAVCVMSAMLAKGARNVKARPVDARRRRDGSASVGGFEDATDRRAGRDGETDDDGSTRDRSQA